MPQLRLAEISGCIGAGRRSCRKCRGDDRGNQRNDADQSRRVALERMPRAFEIGRDRSLAAREIEPPRAGDQRRNRCREGRPRRNTKAANGGAKTTADG